MVASADPLFFYGRIRLLQAAYLCHCTLSAQLYTQCATRSLAEILQESLARTLPPLDDVPAAAADVLAHMSILHDAALWQASTVTIPESLQAALHALTFIFMWVLIAIFISICTVTRRGSSCEPYK